MMVYYHVDKLLSPQRLFTFSYVYIHICTYVRILSLVNNPTEICKKMCKQTKQTPSCTPIV